MAYDGRRKITKRIFELPDGQHQEFDIKLEGNPVCVLALTKENRVILAKQFRPGPEKILFELPGGGTERGETFEQAIVRELLEETGFIGDIQFVGTSLADAYSTLLRYNFVATSCKKVAEPKNPEHEETEVVIMPLDEFRQHLRTGDLTDVTTGYLGLDFLGLL